MKLALTDFTKVFSAILDASHNGIMVLDNDGHIIFYNLAAARIFREDREAMTGKHFSVVRPEAWADLQKVLHSGQTQVGRRFSLPQATIIVNRSPVVIDGEIVGAISVFQDISEYESIISKLKGYQKLHRELEAIFESSEDGLYIADGDAVTIRVNSAYERITGLSRKNLLGKNMQDLVDEGVFDYSVTLEVLEKRQQITLLQNVRGGKQVMVTGTPIFSKTGKIELIVTNVRDITELNQLRSELEYSRLLSSRYYQSILEQEEFNRISQDMVVKSKPMLQVVNRAVKVASSDTTVLLCGESGTGKSMLARAIHKISSRQGKPFVKINCGTIPDSLIESELFGYEKGAFTNARNEGKAGLIEAAQGGTLFLDEIGELKPDLQVKLLEVIEDKSFTRVGGTRRLEVDVRIIAATNRDLKDMMRKNQFREDLYYRISVVPIDIPPLRERPEDISALALEFIEAFNQKNDQQKRLSPGVLNRLMGFPFPGNVRQLFNVLEQMALMSDQTVIGEDDVPIELRDLEEAGSSGRGYPPLRQAVEKLEKRMIRDALEAHASDRLAAHSLGIHPATLCRKIVKFQLR